MEFMKNGWICLDKSKGISSNLAMVKVRKIIREKTGYVGTLDPFATGVLPIAIGRARKFIQFMEEGEKQYEFSVRYGASTNTYDETGEILNQTEIIPNEKQIEEVIPKFLGEIEQIPPKFSAIKINGKRACDLIRRNQEVEIPSRKIHIYDLRLLYFFKNIARFRVKCSKGTYVRTLAVDMAQKLNSLCYVKELRRTKSGFFSIDKSITLENLKKISDTDELDCNLFPVESPLDDIPALYLEEGYVFRLRNGQTVQLENFGNISQTVRLFDVEKKEFWGICSISENGFIKAVKMINGD